MVHPFIVPWCCPTMEEILEAVVLGNANDDDVEHAILHNILVDRQNVELQPAFNLMEIPEDEAKLLFRFERNDILRLSNLLRLPDRIRTVNRNNVSGVTALCIVLRRLAYPNRLSDLSSVFKLSPESLSSVINHTVNLIIENHNDHLDNLNNLNWLTRDRMSYYAQAIQNKGGAVPNCWGFIDGTARQICRPSINQENYYSGHKRVHCLKYQSVLCPDGIISNLKGAYEGRNHDARILRDSLLYEELQEKARFPNGENFVLYGDQAYPIMDLLLCPYPGRPENLTPLQRQFNLSMKTLRVAVEWGFQKIVAQFAFVDFKKNQKLLQGDLESMYKIAVLLTNCHTCLYGSQTASYFNVIPPTLEEYLI